MNAIDRDRMRILQSGLFACQEIIIRINQEIHDILLRTATQAALDARRPTPPPPEPARRVRRKPGPKPKVVELNTETTK